MGGFVSALKCAESMLRQFSPSGCEKVFYAFVLAELFPRQLFWVCFLSSHLSYTPVTASQTKCFTVVISVDGEDRLWFWMCLRCHTWKSWNFAYNTLIHSVLLLTPPPSLNGKFLVVVNFYRLFDLPPYYWMYCTLVQVLEFKVRRKVSISGESLTGFAFPILLNQEVLQLELLTFCFFFSSLCLIFAPHATTETGPTAGKMTHNLVLVYQEADPRWC